VNTFTNHSDRNTVIKLSAFISGCTIPVWNECNAQKMVTLKAKEESGSWGASVRDFIMAAAA
jgi:hypothetical protein